MPSKQLLYVPASEITGVPHFGVATALEALISPILNAQNGDIVAVGASLILTPDDLLFSDAGLSLYRLNGEGYIVNVDILDGMAENYNSAENQVIRSLHFIMNADYMFEAGIREAALELSPRRSSSLSLEFVMLGEALLLCRSDIPHAFAKCRSNGDRSAYIGDIVRSLWYVPIEIPDEKYEKHAAKSLEKFLQCFIPVRTDGTSETMYSVLLPEWLEVTGNSEVLPAMFNWSVNVA